MLKPQCSNCLLYKLGCTTTSGRPSSHQHSKASEINTQPHNSRYARISYLVIGSHANGVVISAELPDSDRLDRIELQLELLLKTVELNATQQAGNRHSSEPHNTALDSVESSIFPGLRGRRETSAHPSTQSTFVTEDLALPPLPEVLPIIDHYFEKFNPLIPLYDEQSFRRLLHGWYGSSSQRNTAAWVSVQVVLALSLRTVVSEALRGSGGPNLRNRASYLLGQVHIVASELAAEDEGLLGIQALLGIVILYQNSNRSSLASVVIGTAMHVAHRLRLHSRLHSTFAADETRLEALAFFGYYMY